MASIALCATTDGMMQMLRLYVGSCLYQVMFINAYITLIIYVIFITHSDSSARTIGTTGSVFETGVGSILVSDVSCSGNESSILNCSINDIGHDGGCNHFQEAGVECLGRPISECVYLCVCV